MSSREQNKPTVPKFASFTRKDPESSATELVAQPGRAVGSRSDSRKLLEVANEEGTRAIKSKSRHHGSHKRSKHSSGNGFHQRHEERSRRSHSPARAAEHPARDSSPLKRLEPAAAVPAGDALFMLDKRGDPLILKYGSNDRSRVPAYRRFGRGRVLGARGFLVTDREGAREVFFFRTLGRDRGPLFREKNSALLRAAEARKGRRVHVKSEVAGADVTLTTASDFVPLSSNTRKRKRGPGDAGDRDAGDGDSSDGGGHPYRTTEVGRAASHEDSDAGGWSDEDGSDAAASGREAGLDDGDDETNKEYMELSRHVKEHPEDVGSWLRFIQLHETRLHSGVDLAAATSTFEGGEAGEAAAATRKGIADIKLYMFEKALSHAKSEEGREQLLLGLMREGAKVWSPKTLAKRWEAVAAENRDSFPLWRARLDHDMTNVSVFSLDGVKAFLAQRIALLKDRLVASPDAGAAGLLCDQLLYVLLRTTRLLQDAGFGELAVACWQAMLEVVFARPPELAGAAADACISSLGEFWESEVARFGEDGSKGWCHFFTSAEMEDAPEPKTSSASVPRPEPSTRDAYKAWAALDRHRARQSDMPGRTLDEGAEDDPFRIVMSSDIEAFLFVPPHLALPHVKVRLAEALLHFCGLPPHQGSSASSARRSLFGYARDDPFIIGVNRLLEAEIRGSKDGRGNLQDDGSGSGSGSNKLPQFSHDHPRMAVSTDVLFPGKCWFSYFPPLGVDAEFDDHDQHQQNTRNFQTWMMGTIKQLAVSSKIEELAEYHLALQWGLEPKGVKKVAKALLKLYPTNIGLYNAYALAEYRNGNSDAARKVLLSATKLKLGSDTTKTQALRNSLAWIELEAADLPKAAAVLCSSTNSDSDDRQQPNQITATMSSPQLLRARQTLQAVRDYQLSSGNIKGAVQHGESFALLEYLTKEGSGAAEPRSQGKQGNISAAISAVLSLSGDLTSRGEVLARSEGHEQLLQFASRLLYFHSRHGPYRPAFLRETLRKFVTLFPQNTMFLSLYAWAESSSPRIDDPVRDLLQRGVLSDPAQDNVGTRVSAVRHELAVGNAHSVQACFERALQAASSSNPGLWLSYVRFCCVVAGREEESRAAAQVGASKSKSKSRSGSRRADRAAALARDVFYRAVGACPWSRDLIMEAFSPGLVGQMPSSELRAAFSTVSSRGLRVYLDLDEFVEALEPAEGGEGKGEEKGGRDEPFDGRVGR